ANDKLIYSAGNARQVDGSTVAYTTQLGVSHSTARGVWNDNQYLLFSHERDDIPATAAAPGQPAVPASVVNTTLVMPGFAISRLVSDDLVLPTEGDRIALDLHDPVALGGQHQVIRHQARDGEARHHQGGIG